MTDSVRCSKDSSNHFTCAVQIDADFDTPDPVSAAPSPPATPPMAPPRPESASAVSTLVSSFASKTLLLAPPAPLISGAALKACVPEELGFALAAIARNKDKLIAALTMAKAAIDTGTCLRNAENAAAEHNAENYCRDLGGVVTRVDADRLVCEVHERAK